MARFENKMGITEIQMNETVSAYCPIGKDWYTNQLTISLVPSETIPDYIEVGEYMKSLGGSKMLIEEVVADIFQHIKDEYNPQHLCVISQVVDAAHLPVKVVKSF